MGYQNWKDHPVSIAAIAVAGTIAVSVLLYKEVILPTHTLSLRNELSSIENQLSQTATENKRLNEEVGSLSKAIGKLEKKNSSLKIKISKLEASNLLTPENPYPPGLDQVRIGDPLEKIESVYNENEFPEVSIDIKSDKRFVTVIGAHSIFFDVTYYIDENDPRLPITHIAFTGYSLPEGVLQEKLVATQGNPDEAPREGFYSWDSAFESVIYKYQDVSYVLMRKGSFLAIWPRKS